MSHSHDVGTHAWVFCDKVNIILKVMVESIGSGCYGSGGLLTLMTVVVVLNIWYVLSLPILCETNLEAIPKHFLLFGQVSSGKADVKRLCISGGSAGGYTTLAALAFRDVFKAGASLYGVSTELFFFFHCPQFSFCIGLSS